MFDRIAARGTAEADAARTIASGLRRLTEDAAEIADSMRALAYLFVKAVAEDGGDNPLTGASYLVVDVIETMAKRLDAIETSAGAAFQPLLDHVRLR